MPSHSSFPDRNVLYEAAVQDVDFDLAFFQRTYRQLNGRAFQWLREDFCGTARLACEWVARRAGRYAIGVDLHRGSLDWAARHHLPYMGRAAERVALVRGDVRRVGGPRVDVIAALNCSYWVFKRRAELIGYFRHARSRLKPGGLLFLDLFGGEGAMKALEESRWVRGQRTWSGRRVPPFRYVWEQQRFNPVDHHLTCHIHFEPRDGRRLRRAFTYDWRMWTLPELDEALREAGFADTMVYVQGWDDDANQPLSIFRRRGHFENQEAWLAYIVGVR